MNNCQMFRNASLKTSKLKLKEISVVGNDQNWFVEYKDVKKEMHSHCKDCAISEAVNSGG